MFHWKFKIYKFKILINLQFNDLLFTIYVLFINLAISSAAANYSLFTIHFSLLPLKGGWGVLSKFKMSRLETSREDMANFS